MIDALNLIAMGLCLVGLIYFLLRTRRVDDVRWWGLRFCIVYALVCTSYLSYDAWAFYGFLPAQMMLIHTGYLALSVSVILIWQLLKKEHKARRRDFATRLQNLLKERV